jgi:hypothetical protein
MAMDHSVESLRLVHQAKGGGLRLCKHGSTMVNPIKAQPGSLLKLKLNKCKPCPLFGQPVLSIHLI